MSEEQEPRDAVTIIASVVGKQIFAATFYDEHPDESWTSHEVVELTFTDATSIRIYGWGHDAWGVCVEDVCDV